MRMGNSEGVEVLVAAPKHHFVRHILFVKYMQGASSTAPTVLASGDELYRPHLSAVSPGISGCTDRDTYEFRA